MQRVRCFSALSSGLTPPPPVIRPRNTTADHQFVGAQLYTAFQHAVRLCDAEAPEFVEDVAIVASI